MNRVIFHAPWLFQPPPFIRFLGNFQPPYNFFPNIYSRLKNRGSNSENNKHDSWPTANYTMAIRKSRQISLSSLIECKANAGTTEKKHDSSASIMNILHNECDSSSSQYTNAPFKRPISPPTVLYSLMETQGAKC